MTEERKDNALEVDSLTVETKLDHVELTDSEAREVFWRWAPVPEWATYVLAAAGTGIGFLLGDLVGAAAGLVMTWIGNRRVPVIAGRRIVKAYARDGIVFGDHAKTRERNTDA